MPKAMVGTKPMTLRDGPLEVGQRAPDFVVQRPDMSDYTLASGAGKTRVFFALLSVDTGVCDAETRRFNEIAAKLDDVEVVAISCDLPMSLNRWCAAAGVENVIVASDHREVSFGRSYGCMMADEPLYRCLYRATFVVGPDDVVRYVDYAKELGEEPDYEAVMAAIRG